MSTYPTSQANHKAIFLVPFFGKYPEWFELFLYTCCLNPDYKWLIHTDGEFDRFPAYNNVEFRSFTLAQFQQALSDLTRLAIPPILCGLKLADYRPVFGELFADDVAGYPFWGHTDIDIFFGRIRKFLTPGILQSDIISSDRWRNSGPFSLYRNTPQINSLYKEVPNWQAAFLDTTRQYFFEELEFSDHIDSICKSRRLRVVRGIGEHGNSESSDPFQFIDGKVLVQWDAWQLTTQTMKTVYRRITRRRYRTLPLGRERIFFHFRRWKS